MTSPLGISTQQEQTIQKYKTNKYKLPPPTPEAAVATAGPDTDVILWRGISYRRLAAMVENGSLSGKVPGNANSTPPTESDAKSQVGTFSKSQVKLPEFTTNPTVAVGFARGGVIVVIGVKKKYLTKGSGSEGGWVGSDDAPYMALLWIPGEGTPGVRLKLNAD